MSAPILKSQYHVGEYTHDWEHIQENTHATSRNEYLSCKRKLTVLQINAPQSCKHPSCLVKRIARNWGLKSGRIRVQLCETLSSADQSSDRYYGSLRGLCPTSV